MCTIIMIGDPYLLESWTDPKHHFLVVIISIKSLEFTAAASVTSFKLKEPLHNSKWKIANRQVEGLGVN